jgi:hypothetical protein
MWSYQQSTGVLSDKTGQCVCVGYAGYGPGKNNPDFERRMGQGPLPRGLYKILAPVDTLTHGPFVLWLEPLPDTELYGRSGFGIHGEAKDPERRGKASHGCPIIDRVHREQIWHSGDHLLEVVK